MRWLSAALLALGLVLAPSAYAGGPTDTTTPPPPPPAVQTACGVGTYLEPSLNQCFSLPNPVTNPVPPGYCGCGWGGYGYYGGWPGWGWGGWPGFGFRPGIG